MPDVETDGPQHRLTQKDLALDRGCCNGASVPILFYEPEGEFGWLSNFSSHNISICGTEFPTVEHFFQAQKFSTSDDFLAVTSAPSPSEAKRIAKIWKSKRKQDWHDIRDSIMYSALKAKFDQHDELSAMLISTAPLRLIENAPDDPYWGIGKDGRGRNRLGELLMQVRSELSARKPQHHNQR
jgi:ribA/ribD-fused uncharacterized protein